MFRGQERIEDWRVPALGLLFFAAGAVLAARLWVVQVRESAKYEGQAARQSIRRVLVAAPRGRLLDRNGVVLAEDRQKVGLAVYMEELRRPGRRTNTVMAVERQIDFVAGYMDLPRRTSRNTIWRHLEQRSAVPLMIADRLDEARVARFAENMEGFEGVDLVVDLERHYPFGELACHVLGYVKLDEIESRPDDERYHFVMRGARGVAGLEQQYNAVLEGEPGVRLVRVDAAGYRYEERDVLPPREGRDVRLTLDARLQLALERSLRADRGAGVVLDVRNGDVLAMASVPGFDVNDMIPAPSRVFWNSLVDNADAPLFNRAAQGRYPPGSTFKVVVALGMLHAGKIAGDETYHCEGRFDLHPKAIRCANNARHGDVDSHKAMMVSCNGYFCWLGQKFGYPPVREMSAAFGFGSRTGIDLPTESAGLLPEKTELSGDTSLICIGQGPILTTPLQMALATAVIANGGRVLRPRLVSEDAPEGGTVRMLQLRFADLQQVRESMLDVIRFGTGRNVNPPVPTAGKTGTAEYIERGQLKKYAWMIAYAPYDDPEIAVAIVVEEGDSGGRTAAPIVRDVLMAHFAEEAR